MSGYCPAHDPILAAGYRWCSPCRAEAFPLDAAWLGPDLILVTYGPLCRHQPDPRTMTVTPSELTPVEDRCAATTRAGTRCRAWPRPGTAYCCQHDRQEAGR